MGQYTVYCNGHEGFNPVSSDNIGSLLGSERTAYLYFDMSSIPVGEVFVSGDSSVYVHAGGCYIRIYEDFYGNFGNFDNPAQWCHSHNGVIKDGSRYSQKIYYRDTNGTLGEWCNVWLNGSSAVPYAAITTRTGVITTTGIYTDKYPNRDTPIKKGFLYTFSWKLKKDSPIHGTLDVAYTDFMYRASNETNWHSIRINGNATSYLFNTSLIPNTGAMELQWGAKITATNGATAGQVEDSKWYWELVPLTSTTVRLTELRPASNGKTYKGFPVTFAWNYSYTKPENLSGSLSQVSAKVRWRVKGASAYTERTLGAAMSLTVDGSTLPVGNLEWQVESENTSGSTSTSDWISFQNIEVPIVLTGIYPEAGGRAVKTVANTFGWTAAPAQSDAPGNITQTSAVLRYRTKGQSNAATIPINGAQNSYTIPANTFKADEIEWQVTVTANTGTTSASEWIPIYTNDVDSIPTPVSPIGEVVNDQTGIIFRWQHVISTGTAQTGWELSQSTDGGAHWTVFAQGSGGAQQHSMPKGSIPTGMVYWRVRTKNSEGKFGQYSAFATIIVMRAPDVPVIVQLDNKPIPTIQWQASDQKAYRVTIGQFDTGWVYGTQKSYRHSDVLPDGEYELTITIQAEGGMESTPTKTTLVIKNIPGEEIPLHISEKQNFVSLGWTAEDESAVSYVLRDGVPISKVYGERYSDYLACGKHIYQIRIFDKNGYYTDSKPMVAWSRVKNAVLSDLDEIDWIILEKKRGGPPVHSIQEDPQTTFRHYSGIEMPSPVESEFTDTSHTFTFTLKSREQFERLRALRHKRVLYKDAHGDRVIGIRGQLSADLTHVEDFSFSITEIDFEERIPYE